MAYKSNLNNVLKTFRNNINEAMDACAPAGEEYIKREAPVITGNLRDSTKSQRNSFDSVDFYNDASYAAYVNFGTYKQAANPFFFRGLLNALPTFKALIFQKMKL